jgi:hypothetical protein
VLVSVQRDLFAIGALLATPDPEQMAQHPQKAPTDHPRTPVLLPPLRFPGSPPRPGRERRRHRGLRAGADDGRELLPEPDE